MKTEDLVSLLASGVEPVEGRYVGRRLLAGWAAGMLVSVLLLAVSLRINANLAHEALIPVFWVRSAFCASLAVVAAVAVGRLGRPGARLGVLRLGLLLPVMAVWILATVVLANAAPADRLRLVLGHTAFVCPWLIALLAAPVFLTLIWVARGLAPTRLRLAGATAGFAAGAGGALVYTLHCPELAPPFFGLWYLLGMLIPAGLGAALGPRLLRW